MRLALLLSVALLAVAGCDSADDVPLTCDNISLSIETEELAPGTGTAVASRTSTVQLDYVGTLEDGSEFDSGTDVVFGLARTVSGFSEGVAGMRLGGQRRITIPPYRGYGTQVRRNGEGETVIPACSTLIFEVTLDDILG